MDRTSTLCMFISTLNLVFPSRLLQMGLSCRWWSWHRRRWHVTSRLAWWRSTRCRYPSPCSCVSPSGVSRTVRRTSGNLPAGLTAAVQLASHRNVRVLCHYFLHKGIALSVRPSVHHENLKLALTLPFLKMSASNIQIILLMTTRTWWCQII